MLGLMSTKMFRHPEDHKKHDPNPYGRMMQQLFIGNPEEYRKRLVPMKIPFNCKEKVECDIYCQDNFREAPWHEGKDYKIHELNENEKTNLHIYQHQRKT